MPKVPSFVDAGSRFLDFAASCVMFDVCNIRGLLERSQLDRPDGLFDRLVEFGIALAFPKGLNYVFNANNAFLSEKFFDEHVVSYGESFELFAF